MNVALSQCYAREGGVMFPGKVGKFGFGGLWSLGRWEQCQKKNFTWEGREAKRNTQRWEMSAQRHISGLTGVLGTWLGWGGGEAEARGEGWADHIEPWVACGRFWATGSQERQFHPDQRWLTLGLPLSLITGTMTAQWCRGRRGQVEQWYAQGTLSQYVNTKLAQ